MDIFDVKYALENLIVLVDSREQETPALRKRLEDMDRPYMRQKLDFADYSAKCVFPSGRIIDFSNHFAVERKMSLDELCNCFCKGRLRFTKEFERAKKKKAKMYLLIEKGSWEQAYNGEYRSLMSPSAFVASLQAWLARYNCQLLFCKPEISGKLISGIIYREAKEHLESGEFDGYCNDNLRTN